MSSRWPQPSDEALADLDAALRDVVTARLELALAARRVAAAARAEGIRSTTTGIRSNSLGEWRTGKFTPSLEGARAARSELAKRRRS